MRLQARWLQTFDSSRQDDAQAAEHLILRKVREQPEAACVKRILRMIELLRSAESLRLQLYEKRKTLRDDPTSRAKYGANLLVNRFAHPDLADIRVSADTFRSLLREIGSLGKRYHWSPTVGGPGFWGLSRMFTWASGTQEEEWENWAIFYLTGLFQNTGLSPSKILRFRHCKQCRVLFYATTDHQLQCSAACRQKFHASSPEFRAKRAKYMRERYRPAEKERDLRAKTAVKRGTSK